MKFTKTHTDWNGEFLETISMEMREDAQIDDVLETFSRFLKAVGYHFDGEIQIVDQEETDFLNDDQDWSFDDEVEEDEMTPAFEGPIEGFNDGVQVDDLSTDLPKEWPFPTKSKP
jgi:hypothetical protein